MTIDTLLKDYTAYNFWANTRIADWLRLKPAALMTQEILSSFPSLRLTLLHIWDAEHVWLERLRDEPPSEFNTDYFSGTTEEAFAGMLDCSKAFHDFVSAQKPDYFSGQSSYVHSSGKRYTQNRAQMILHCMQHSTFHRGQIITIARNLGLTDPPQTDYIAYVRLQG